MEFVALLAFLATGAFTILLIISLFNKKWNKKKLGIGLGISIVLLIVGATTGDFSVEQAEAPVVTTKTQQSTQSNNDQKK